MQTSEKTTARIAPMLSYRDRDRETERESLDTHKWKIHLCLSLTVSLNRKYEYKDFRSLSLIGRALSFAVLPILNTPWALHVLWIMQALFNSLTFPGQ